MAQSLLLYASHDGQTARIMSSIAAELRAKNIEVDQLLLSANAPLRQLTAEDLLEYSSVLIGAPIRYGRHMTAIQRFVGENHNWLNQIKSGFFSVNLTARKPERNSRETNPYLKRMLSQVGWQPDMVEVFAGSLQYSRYPFYDRLMIQLIMKMTGGSTDTSKDIEYTDWNKVNDFADRWAKYIAPSAR
ncbi:menaquinone-dependent protoporphyrinogen IX dehydrogenase [Endozoicomonadaceae bacterium StTr2]